MVDNIASKCSAEGISARNGLLWMNGRSLDCYQADTVARQYGFAYAEQLVHHLQGDKPKEHGRGTICVVGSNFDPSLVRNAVEAGRQTGVSVVVAGSESRTDSKGGMGLPPENTTVETTYDCTGIQPGDIVEMENSFRKASSYHKSMLGAYMALGMGAMEGIDIHRADPPHAEDVVKMSTKCLLDGCNKNRRGNGGYCCAEHCREDRRREKERRNNR